MGHPYKLAFMREAGRTCSQVSVGLVDMCALNRMSSRRESNGANCPDQSLPKWLYLGSKYEWKGDNHPMPINHRWRFLDLQGRVRPVSLSCALGFEDARRMARRCAHAGRTCSQVSVRLGRHVRIEPDEFEEGVKRCELS